MKVGDHVAVHSGRTYTDDATIEGLCHPDELPAIAGVPNVESVRAILAEGNYVAIALISYDFLGTPVCFVAFQDARGQWTDLKGTPLIIEPRTASNDLERLLKNQQEQRTEKMRIVSRGGSKIDWRKF
jgi:hypothetical protein